jgi:hypothetical protein
MLGAVLRALLVSVAVLGCTNTTDTPEKKSGRAGRGDHDPIPCETDKDCPPIACGPCTPGTPVTTANSGFDCKVDPCIDGGAVCSADEVCVVRPEAKPRPARGDAKPR